MFEDLQHQPPVAREFPVKHKHHGIVREDPWHWLRERDNPRVLAHLEAENAYTAAVMQAAGDLPGRLFEELRGRIEESSRSAPYPKDGYLYQSRIEAGQNYRMYYRKPLGGGDWRLYLDANAEADGLAYFDLGFLDVSPCGRWLAYAVDLVGEENYRLKFRDLETGRDLPAVIEPVSADGEWDASGRCFYFIREDDSRRPFRIYRHVIGADPAAAELVYEEPDPVYYAGIYKSQDGRYLFASSESQETTEISVLPADDPAGRFSVLLPRRVGIEYWVEHQHGNWLIRIDEDAPDFKLLALPVGATDLARATVLAPPRAGIHLRYVVPLRDYRVYVERRAGLNSVRVESLLDGTTHTITVPDEVYDFDTGMNAEFDTEFLQLNYSNPVRPPATFRYNLRTREREVLRQVSVPSGHDPERYTAYRLHVPSHDGALVPMTVFHHRDLPRDGSRPAYLFGYGAYGRPEEADFRSSSLTWVDRGFTVAIAHVRGGGLLGDQWYQDGKLEKKPNTFLDFIACAEKLIADGYTRPDRLVIEGGSAGGLLVGAVINQRPELFRAAVAAVPFVDVVNTMLDPSLPLTTFEYEEWGNPGEKHFFEALMAYSPYENVQPADYPALLVTSGFNDPRVPYWEAAKWVAKLRKHTTSRAPILLKTNLLSGHTGASGRYDYLREIAFEQAFLLWQLTPVMQPLEPGWPEVPGH